MYVDVAVVQVCVTENGQGVFVGFAEVEYQGLAGVYADRQLTFKEFALVDFFVGAVMVVEADFATGDALGVPQEACNAGFVVGSGDADVFRVDSECAVYETVFFDKLDAFV